MKHRTNIDPHLPSGNHMWQWKISHFELKPPFIVDFQLPCYRRRNIGTPELHTSRSFARPVLSANKAWGLGPEQYGIPWASQSMIDLYWMVVSTCFNPSETY